MYLFPRTILVKVPICLAFYYLLGLEVAKNLVCLYKTLFIFLKTDSELWKWHLIVQ